MERHEDLARLESIVEKLLSQYKDLRHEKEQLEDTLFQRQQEITALKAQIADLQDDKTDVHKRVSDIIGSIEDWERDNSALTQMGLIPEKHPERDEEIS